MGNMKQQYKIMIIVFINIPYSFIALNSSVWLFIPLIIPDPINMMSATIPNITDAF